MPQGPAALHSLLAKLSRATAPKPPEPPKASKAAGLVEWILRKGSDLLGDEESRIVDGDSKYLRQYAGDPVLRPTSLRPAAGDVKNRPVYESLLSNDSATFLPAENLAQWPTEPRRLNGRITDAGQLDPVDGLGQFVISGSTDAKGPYLSVYDHWDLDSPNVPKLLGKIGDKLLGNPYVVYDQFDVAPDPTSGNSGRLTLKRRKALDTPPAGVKR